MNEQAGGSWRDMMPETVPCGLFELNAAGTVTRYTPADENNPASHPEAILGRNFFDEVLPVTEVREFKSRFLAFMTYGDEVQRFNIVFPFDDSSVELHIVLARISERYELGGERLALIRLAQNVTARRP